MSDSTEVLALLEATLAHTQARLMAFTQPVILHAATLVEQQVENIPDVLKAYMSMFISHSPVMAGLLDADSKFVAVSKPCVAWLNRYQRGRDNGAAVLGQRFADVFVNAPEIIVRSIKASLKGANRYQEGLLWPLTRRRSRWVRWESFPWIDQKGGYRGVIFFCEDITNQQESLLLNRNLQRANELLENFSSVFSHDLLQPIRQVSNFVTILKEYLDKTYAQDEFVNDTFARLQHSLRQIYDLSEGMAVYCKNGELAANPRPVVFNDVVEQIRETCAPTAAVITTIDPEITVFMNPTCLWQLLQNLITNGIKYAQGDHPVVTISGQALENGFMECTVHNTGYCPSRRIRQHVFDPFQSTQVHGAGLGMTICKQIVTAYKGKIDFQSSPKKGTRVTFTLPLFQPSQPTLQLSA
jgi:signal transduction histidine kinase